MADSRKSPIATHRDGLLLEGALASDALGHGLTALRRYDFADKGRFFVSMFALTIGLERVLKLIVIISEAEDRGSFPGNERLREAGHDISDLLRCARSVNERKALGVDTSKLDDELCARIVEHLSSFAKHARYYNLDRMTGSTKAWNEEPLAAWDRIVGGEVVKRHHRNTRRCQDALAFGEALVGIPGALVTHTLEDGTHVADTGALAAAAVHIETKQKYSVYYTLCIIEFCVDVLVALDQRQAHPIYLYEYFRVFNTLDRKGVLRRKKWDPLL